MLTQGFHGKGVKKAQGDRLIFWEKEKKNNKRMRFEILQILAHELHFFFKEQKPNYVIFVSLIKASENTTTKNGYIPER